MVIFNPTFYLLLFLGLFLIGGTIAAINRKSGLFIFLLLLPGAALYFLCTYFLLPLPLNAEGLSAVYLPKTPVRMVPFLSAFSRIQEEGLLPYLHETLPLLSAAVLAGCGVPFLFRRKRAFSALAAGFSFVLVFFLIQLLIRGFTGCEGRPADVTDLCLYLIFEGLGFLAYALVDKHYPEFRESVHTDRPADAAFTD